MRLYALAAVLLALGLTGWTVPAQESRSAPAEPDSPTEALAVLRELSELDLVGELVPRGRAWVSEGGLLVESGEARALVARALWSAGEEDEARALLEPDGLPERERVWLDLERARVHLLADELESAVRELTRPDESAPESGRRTLRHPEVAESWLLLARAYARAGDLERAAPLAREFLSRAGLHPGAPAAWHLLASAALEQRDGAKAQELLARARELERWHEIVNARRLQIRRSPDEPLPRLGLALAYLQVGANDRAREVLEDLVERHPEFARGWFHLGEALRLSGDLEGARAAYGRAVEADAAQHLARYDLAMVDRLLGRPAEAREALELLVSIPEVETDPRFAEAHRHLAELCEAAGESEAAARHRERYRELTE